MLTRLQIEPLLKCYLVIFRDSIDGILRKVADVNTEEWRDLMKIQEKACKEIESQQQMEKDNYDKKRYRTISYEPWEIVSIKHSPKHTAKPTKTQSKYRGPLIVIDASTPPQLRSVSLSYGIFMKMMIQMTQNMVMNTFNCIWMFIQESYDRS